MVKASKEAGELTEEEEAKRRDQIAKRMLNTPPKPRIKPKSKPKKEAPEK